MDQSARSRRERPERRARAHISHFARSTRHTRKRSIVRSARYAPIPYEERHKTESTTGPAQPGGQCRHGPPCTASAGRRLTPRRPRRRQPPPPPRRRACAWCLRTESPHRYTHRLRGAMHPHTGGTPQAHASCAQQATPQQRARACPGIHNIDSMRHRFKDPPWPAGSSSPSSSSSSSSPSSARTARAGRAALACQRSWRTTLAAQQPLAAT
jgi:hypothetical protein